MKALDVASVTTGHAHELQALGYEAVGVYLRPDRTTLEMIQGLHSVGIKIFSVYEKGKPISVKYFTAAQGKKDGAAAVAFAKKIGQPAGKEIFSAVDYDANWATDGDAITAYQKAFREVVKAAGYLASVYGSGVVCSHLVNAGWAHSGWLSQSKGWAGYKDFLSKASIIQGPVATVLHFDVDLDTVVDKAVCW